MKKKWLISWIGETDHRAAEGTLDGGVGPIANALLSNTKYDRIFLLTNYPHQRSFDFCTWLESKCSYDSRSIDLQDTELDNPTNYAAIYEGVCQTLAAIQLPRPDVELHFHLSPGTPAMAAIWIMLAKTRFPATLIQSTKQKCADGTSEFEIETVDFSFDLASDFLPEFLRRSNARIERLNSSNFDVGPAFAKIIHQSNVMREQIDLAKRIAVHDVPVLILGETGTGKELFAEAIVQTSYRKDKPYIAINCGAISRDLINSELFGHKKGAFTGADANHKGYFLQADGGTLFLDEIGDLPLDAQIRLLRAIQQGQITPLGESKPLDVNVRIIAATHRDLTASIASGSFREDLFHRLAVGILNLPPLRERAEDIEILIEHYLEKINTDSKDQPEWQHKYISPEAKILLLEHHWSGNVRELYHTLLRVAIWSKQSEIGEIDIQNNFLRIPSHVNDVMNQNLRKGFDLQGVLDNVERAYIQRALNKAQGKKRAAELLGISNYQTLTNRMARLGIDFDKNEN